VEALEKAGSAAAGSFEELLSGLSSKAILYALHHRSKNREFQAQVLASKEETMMKLEAFIALIVLSGALAGLSGCCGECEDSGGAQPSGTGEVVVYCALDRNFSEPLLDEFEKRTGIKVRAQYDVETTKTVGLFNKIKETMNRPRCDVFWNNELMLTILLKQLGALQPYESPSAADIPAGFKDPERYWTGFAARARILIVNTDILTDRTEWPASYTDLLDPAWKSNCGMARPLTGTTATHGTVLFQLLGEEKAQAFFEGVVANDAHMAPGNAHLMRQVRKGEYAFGFTDTDDFNVARLDGFPVAAVYPDQGAGHPGTLVIPNSVAMIKGCPNPENARKLIDYILSTEIEEKLAFADSAQIPLRTTVKHPDHVKLPGKDFRAMEVDFEKAATEYDKRQEYFRETFLK
jgi:iron(III) transport system substrate-binding protein